MRTVEINIYKFDELSDNVKEKVLQRFRENNDFPLLTDILNDRLNELLKENKIEVLGGLGIYYNLNHCQGDGVCFIGDFEYNGIYFYVMWVGRYTHYNSVDINHELNYDVLDEGKITDKEQDGIVREFRDEYKEICKELEKTGYKEIEYQNSDETIKETIEANEYEFYDNGDIY